jgi:hypothetical protein
MLIAPPRQLPAPHAQGSDSFTRGLTNLWTMTPFAYLGQIRGSQVKAATTGPLSLVRPERLNICSNLIRGEYLQCNIYKCFFCQMGW